MKHFIKTIALLFMIGSSLQVTAQTQEEMQKWMEYMTPSGMQKMMAGWDGEWTEEVSMWMAPGAPEQKMQTTTVNRMILGGRYQESKHTGNFQGMPFEGLGTLGWDNAAKKFINTWVDNMGTGIMYLEGTWDEASKTINLSGTMTDPMTGKQVKIREEIKIIDDNTQQITQYNEKDGKEFKGMVIVSKRKK
ncbi:MAG: DUF1579 domain-containing protein [Chitinophagaceae bacterium]|nr:DUF1579 domain-containing protein [Chitinophagaceae bacterium]